LYLSRTPPDLSEVQQLRNIPDITSGAAPSTARISTQLLSFIAPAIGPLVEDLYAAAHAPDSTTLARAFVALYKINKGLEALQKLVGSLEAAYKTEVLPDTFELDQITSIPLKEGYRVTLSAKLRASVRGGKQPGAIKWLTSEGHGDIVKPSINANTLSSLATTLLREDLKELPDDLFNVAIQPAVSVTGAGVKKAIARPDFAEAE
jgi:hypothetical protein